jgi:hypothetical protein
MTTEITGIVEDAGGNVIQGARVFVVRESDDTVVATETTDSLGEYQVVGLSDFETYFVVAEYDDGSTKYNGTSYPVVTPFTGTGPIDDFEDADIVEYSGEKVSFEIINSPVFDGTNALGMTNDDGSGHLITSQSGLPRYPEEGDTFSFRTYLEPDAQTSAFLFGVQDSDNYYRARILDSTFASEISIGKVSGGSRSTFDSKFASIPANEWLEGIVEWQTGGDMRFTLNDSGGNTIKETDLVNDTEFSTETGFGWLGNVDGFSGDNVYYDLAQITQISGTPEVTTLSPTDVSGSEATLEGKLDSLGSDSSADVYFEWREVGASTFNQTTKQTKSATGNFSETITGLNVSTDYEYRAIAENSVGTTEAGLISFTATSLIHHYKMDEGSGSTAFDYEGNNDATINGAVWTTTAKTGGYALDFDGTDDYAEPNVIDPSGAFSITVWVKTSDLSRNTFIYAQDRTNNSVSYALMMSNDVLDTEFSNGTFVSLTGSTVLSDGNWHHLAYTWDESTLKGYVDASQETSASVGGTLNPPTNTVMAGRPDEDFEYMNGILDDVRFYDEALSQSEIQDIYDNTK